MMSAKTKKQTESPVIKGASIAFIISSIIIMTVLTYAVSISSRTSFDTRSRAVYPSPPPPPPPFYYGVAYYNQTASPWGTIPLEGGKCLFKSIGCGTTVAASILSTKVNSIYNPAYTYQNVFPWLNCNGFGAEDVGSVLKSRFNINGAKIASSRQEVVNYVTANKDVIVGAAITKPNGTVVNHVTLAVHYNVSENKLIFNDPLFGAGIALEAKGYSINWGTSYNYKLN
jgi:hypothetical protein